MSIGSKIYKRFGLKFALAYRIRKTKRKILRKTFVQKPLMLYFLFNLQRDFKAFRIYRTLRQQNILIANPKNLNFILQHYKLILQWLNSKEFKEQYLATHHPYPPLLNPKRLNVKRESQRIEKDSKNQKNVLDKESKSYNEIKNGLDSKDIQPYPNLSYESISPELAWDLNLPLPPYYGFIIARGHGSGGAAMDRFLACCGTQTIYQPGKTPLFDFCTIYRFLLISRTSYNIVGLNHYGYHSKFANDKKQRDKFFCLFAAKVPLLFQTRDSIGQLKHSLKRHWTSQFSNKTLNVDDDFMHIFPDMKQKVLPSDFETYKEQVFIQHSLIHSLQACNEIIFMDMTEISKENAFTTLCSLSKRFGFNKPKDEDKNIFEAKSYVGFLNVLVPIDIVCKNIKIKILIPGKYVDLDDCTELFLGSRQYSFALFASKEDLIILKNDKKLFEYCKKYLDKFAKILEEKIKEAEETTYKERDILEHLHKCKKARENLKKILDEQLIDIKKLRPDIVESWKYYQEFERMCEELDK